MQRGDAFFAWPGQAHDARRFVAPALAAGAAACLVEADGVAAFDFADERVAALRGLKAAAGAIASAFLDQPSRSLDLLAVTGTNGKTSTAWWLAQALGALGRRCGVVGTLGIGEPPLARRDDRCASARATSSHRPDDARPGRVADGVAPLRRPGLRRLRDRGLVDRARRAAPRRHARSSWRCSPTSRATTSTTTARWTAYWEAKAALFDWPGLQAAVVNIDDEQGAALAERLRDAARSTCGPARCTDAARLAARAIGYRDGGLGFDVREGDAALPVRTALIGGFNVANLLGVIGGLRALGVLAGRRGRGLQPR